MRPAAAMALPFAATLLALLVATPMATPASAAAGAERREQDCFCTGLWACIARTGLIYSECDQTGMRVICCVRRADGRAAAPRLPMRPVPALAPTPRPDDADLTDLAEPGPPRHAPPALAAPAPFRPATVRAAPTSTPPTYTTTIDYSGEEAVEDEDVGATTASPRVPPTTPRPRPPRPPRPAARPFSLFVTPVPAQPARPSSRPHADLGAQDMGWEDDTPDASWSAEDEANVTRERSPQQQQPQRLSKRIDWTNLGRTQLLHAKAQPPPQATQAAKPNPSPSQGLAPQARPQPQPKQQPKQPVAVPWSSWKECGFKGADSGLEGVAEPAEWPWHAAILETASDRYVCGATLVGPVWMLTAAHCVVDYPEPSALKVRVGELDVRSDSESFTQERAVVQLVPHPAFDLPSLRHDVALVRLARPPRDHRNVAAVCLPPPPPARTARQRDAADEHADEHADALHLALDPDDEFPREGTVCVVTGWGRKDEMSPHSEVLKEVAVPVWSRGPCQEALRAHLGSSFRLPRTTLCAGAKGRDACDGDGGGPLVCHSAGPHGGRWYQMGIVSYGIGCGRRNSPGVYTRMSSYTAWVRSVTGAMRSLDAGPPAPRPTGPAPPLPQASGARPSGSPRSLALPLPGPAVSRVRVNHYTGPAPGSAAKGGKGASTTTARAPTTRPPTTRAPATRPPTRSVVVLSSGENDSRSSSYSEEDDDDEEEDAMDVTERETVGTTPTTPSTTVTLPTTAPTTQSPRSGRVVPWGSKGGSGSYVRTSFGSSWNYPQEANKAAATVTSSQRVALPPGPVLPGAPGMTNMASMAKWYSPAYSGSYRGTLGGARVPGQILSNVAGRTAGGLNRWYSPFYTGSYRGEYSALPKGEAMTSTAPPATTMSPMPMPPRAAYNVRPPLAAPRWYAPLHDQGHRWYTSYHNGTYRTSIVSNAVGDDAVGKHRFAAPIGASSSDEGGDDPPHDLTWTYLVRTGTQGTTIVLDKGSQENASSAGPHGEASAPHPSVANTTGTSASGLGQGRTLVNFTNTFAYPSAGAVGGSARNHTHGHGGHGGHGGQGGHGRHHSPQAAGSSLSSSYSIYRIYPSVYNPDYQPNRAGRGRDAKVIGAEGTGPLKGSDTSRNSIVGYSHFSSGGTAVHFNITHDQPSVSPSPAPSVAPMTVSALPAVSSSAVPTMVTDRAAPTSTPVSAADVDVTAEAGPVGPDEVPVLTTIAALDLTTLRAATAEATAEDSTTGGEGMDMPPVTIVSTASTTEAETGAPPATTSAAGSLTSTPPTESATTLGTELTTRDVMTTTTASLAMETEAFAVGARRGRGRGLARLPAAEEGDGMERADLPRAVPAMGPVSALARRGGHHAADPDGVFAMRRHRPEDAADAARPAEGRQAWGDKTSRRGRTQQWQHSSRGGRRLDAPAAEVDASSTAAPRPRSRSRSRPQHPEEAQPAQPPTTTSGPGAAVGLSPRPAKERPAFHPGVRHSKVVDVADHPDVVFVPTPAAMPDLPSERAFRPRGRRPHPPPSPAPIHARPAPPQPAPPAPPTPSPSPAPVTSPGADGLSADVPHFVAEVRPPRTRGRSRTADANRRRVSVTAAPRAEDGELLQPLQSGPPHDADPEQAFSPTPLPQRYSYHVQPQPPHQRVVAKKSRKQLKKVSLAGAGVAAFPGLASSSEARGERGERGEPFEIVFAPSSSPAPIRHEARQHHAWFPADVVAEAVAAADVQDPIDDPSAERADERVSELQDDAVEDPVEELEREDVYSFLSQRAQRRRPNAESVPAEDLPQTPQPPQSPRWSRKGSPPRRRGQAGLSQVAAEE